MKENSERIIEFLKEAKNEALIAAIALAGIWGVVECNKNNNNKSMTV